eukprot:s1165_g8.t1
MRTNPLPALRLAQVAMAFARQRLTSTPVVGKVVEWKKTHGWIEPECSIDHPDIGKHQGHIFVHGEDIVPKRRGLVAGSMVEFILYFDGHGLGAEECMARKVLRVTLAWKQAQDLFGADGQGLAEFEAKMQVSIRAYQWCQMDGTNSDLPFLLFEIWGRPQAATRLGLLNLGTLKINHGCVFKLAAELCSSYNSIYVVSSLVLALVCFRIMALDTLRYGNFKSTYVASDAKALPGYGGEVQGWADYKFAVQAIEVKESKISETEQKKLGPLALRLTERLAGPALQVAKKIGVEGLAKPTGVKTLMNALEKQLLPLKRQAAMELYNAGMKDGLLSRQQGEPVSSYCLRREAWWIQLREMDEGIQCSDSILGEQLLQHAGLSHLEMQMVRTVCQNDLSDREKLVTALRDQFGQIHEKESRGKGKGRYDDKPWHQRSSYHAADTDETYDESSTMPQTGNTAESYGGTYEDDESYYPEDESWAFEDDPREIEIEEEVIAWYSSQNIDAQTCSAEDLDMLVDAVEVEISAYYNKMQAEHRGVTSPAGSSNYGGSTLSSQERQAKVLAAKQRARCRACGQVGHWQRDPVCPHRKGRGKGAGKKGKWKNPGKKGDGKDSKGNSPKGNANKGFKPRAVYFSVRDDSGEDGLGYMVIKSGSSDGPETLDEPLDAVHQQMLEAEVMRLMQLPPEEVDRRLQEELNYMPPTAKAPPQGFVPPVSKSFLPPTAKAPPKEWQMLHCGGQGSVPKTNAYVTAEYMQSLRPGTPSIPDVPPMPSQRRDAGDPPDGPQPGGGCRHENITRRGSNAYIEMETCKDCGAILKKVHKDPGTRDRPMANADPINCTHHENLISWKGTNGYSWKWTCEGCGMSRTVKKVPGMPRPKPGIPLEDENINDNNEATEIGLPSMLDETLVSLADEWERLSSLLHRMVANHLALHGTVTHGEFLHITNATILCYKTLGATFTNAVAMGSRETALLRSPGARSQTSVASATTMRSESGGVSGDNKVTFGRYKGYTFADVYETDQGYVQFALDEEAKGAAFCTNMTRFQTYCKNRRDREGSAACFMVVDDGTWADGDFPEGLGEDDGILMYLDSGCNSTCHGAKWMANYERKTGYSPEWESHQTRDMTGIGGAARSLGTRKLYIALETLEGFKVPGEIVSTEIADSAAPLLLSLQAQQDLGMVIDLVAGIVTSKTLGCTFNVVRCKRNRLLGLRLHPGDYMDDGDTIPVSLMVDSGGDDRRPPSPPKHYLKVTTEVKKVPKRKKKGNDKGTSSRATASGASSSRPDPQSSAMSATRTNNTSDDFIWVEAEESDGETERLANQAAHGDLDDPVTNPELGARILYDELGRYTNDAEDGGNGPGEPDPEGTPEGVEDDEDFWEFTDDALIRHHVIPRFDYYHPDYHLLEMPVDVSRLGETRTTNLIYDDKPEETEIIRDQWRFGTMPLNHPRKWTGSTTFTLKPIEEQLKMTKIDWKDGAKKTLTKGQKKRLTKEVNNMENEDVALWSTLRNQKLTFSRGWKALLELFAGCAVLTSVFQASGHLCCASLDINSGWNVFDAGHRRYVEELIDKENPYLVTIAFPCGPWSPWQRLNMANDEATWERVSESRRQWLQIFKWIRKIAKKQQEKGGKTMLENPWPSEAWITSEMEQVLNLGMTAIKVDMCYFKLCDRESGLPHKKATCLATDSPGIATVMEGCLCPGHHQHQPLEGNNIYGSRCTQAGRYTVRFSKKVLQGMQQDLQDQMCCAFFNEELIEDAEEAHDGETLDAIHTSADLGHNTKESIEETVEHEEMLEQLDKEADPESEKTRREEWRKLTKAERVGIRRLHHMTSHATKPQMMRMLKYANAARHVVRAVKHFRCPSCDRIEPEKRPQVVKPPDPYVFNETTGLDIFTIQDAFGDSFQILHIMCVGTNFHTAEVIGPSQGVPSSSKCLQIILRIWVNWAGVPRYMLVDRGTHNRGIMLSELEKRGCTFRMIGLEAPYQLGKIERAGGVLKGMMKRVIASNTVVGQDELQLCLTECLETKNRCTTVNGFSPVQWVLGRSPRAQGWFDEAEEEDTFQVLDPDPMSSFNRRGAMRESARLACAMEDSHRRVRAAILRKGGAHEETFRPGDMVAFMRKQKSGGWVGPARVLACEGKNVWLLHSGIPILVASNRVRGANAEEHLEAELLDKSRLSRKRPFMERDAVRQPHRLDLPGQQPYMDMRPQGHGGGRTTDDDDAKRIRSSGDEGGHSQVRSTSGDPTSAPAAEQPPQQDRDIEELLDAAVEQGGGSDRPFYRPGLPSPAPAETSSTTTTPATAAEPSVPVTLERDMSQTPLWKAMTQEGGNRLDVGATRSRTMRSEAPSREPSAAELTMSRTRSRSPPSEKARDAALVALSREFVCFMAKRKGKADNNEINYGKASEEMQQKLNQSRAKEWANWMKYKAVRFPTEDELTVLREQGEDEIPMRWVDIDKNEKLRVPGGDPVPEKLKSRLVIRGDLEQQQFRTDCPTASSTCVHILLSYAACRGFQIHSGDITAAFLQGAPIQRTLLLRAPKDGIPLEDGGFIDPYTLMIALMSVYGSKDAPRGFWLELRATILANKLLEVDPAFYVLQKDGEILGMLCSHVDDLLWCGTEEMDAVMASIQERFTFGSTEHGSFRFCGRKITTEEDYIHVQTPESLAKVKPIHIEGGRERPLSDDASETEISQMRAVLGSIGWVARLCRPELCYACSSLQGKQSKPTVEDLKQTNKLLSSAQKTKDNGIKFMKGKFCFETSILLSITDASHGGEVEINAEGNKQGHRSQGGRILLLADRVPDESGETCIHILEWHSQTLKRVCRSTLQAEVLSSMLGSEAAQQVRALLHSLHCPRIPGDRGKEWKIQAADSKLIIWMSDCKSFIDYMSATTPGSVSDKRLAIDMSSLRQELWRKHGEEVGDPSGSSAMPVNATDQLIWICTGDMVADQLTKSMRWDALRKLCDHGTLRLTVKPVVETIDALAMKREDSKDSETLCVNLLLPESRLWKVDLFQLQHFGGLEVSSTITITDPMPCRTLTLQAMQSNFRSALHGLIAQACD